MTGQEEAPGLASPVTRGDVLVARDYLDLNLGPTCQAHDAEGKRAVRASRRLPLVVEVKKREIEPWPLRVPHIPGPRPMDGG